MSLKAKIDKLEQQLSVLTSSVGSLITKNQNLAGSSQNNQQSGEASLLAALKNTLADQTSSTTRSGTKHDGDMNAEEIFKALSPMYALKQNMQWAGEHSDVNTLVNFRNQVLQNAITTAKRIDADASTALGNRLHLATNATAASLNFPKYFPEMAPAGQDTPGEGSDPGLKTTK